MKPSHKFLTFCFLAFGIPGTASAVNFYWDGTSTSADADGGDGTWDAGTLTNWDDAAVAGADIVWPTTGTDNDAFFAGTAGTVTVDGAGVAANSLTFSTAGYLIQGGQLTLNGSTPTISNSVAATINSEIAGSGGLTKTGAGILTLTGTNTYTGTTTISSGSIVLEGADNRLATTGSLTFSGSGTLDLGGNSQTLSNLSILTATANVSGVLTNGSLTLNGANALTITPSVTTGGRIASMDASGLSSLTISKTGQTITVGGLNNATSPGNSAIFKLSSESNTITASSINVGTTSGANATGVINKGEIELGLANTINVDFWTLGNTRDGGIVRFMSGLDNPLVTLRGQNGTSRVTKITVGQNAAGGTLVGTSSFDLGTGSVDLLVTDLVLSRGGSASTSTGPAVNGSFSMAGGNVDATNIWLSKNEAGGRNSTNTSHFYQLGGDVKVASLIFGETSNVLTTGTLPTFNSQYTLTMGKLAVGEIKAGGGTFATGSTRRINFNGGTITHVDASTDLSINGRSGTGGTLSIVLGTTGSPTIHADAGRTVTLGAFTALSGAGSLTKSGAGTLSLNSAATYTGLTQINGGTWIVGGTNFLPSATGLTLANTAGAVLDLNNFDQTISTLSGGGSSGGNVLLGSASLTVSGSGVVPYSGQISGTGGLVKTGVGMLVLAGSNTYSGGTTVTSGTIALEHASAIGSTGTITMNGGGLRFSASNTTDYSSRMILVDGKATTFNTNGQNLTFANVLQTQPLKTSSIVKTGAGTLSLTPNTTASFTGMNVSGGTLEITSGSYTITGSAATGAPDGTSGFVVSRGGTFRLNGGNVTATGGSYVFTAGNTGGSISNFILDSGTFDAGSREILNAYGSFGTFTMNEGLFVGGEFRISQSAEGTVNLNGGILRVTNLKSANNTEIINFNGGTVEAKSDRSEFITAGVDQVNILQNGAFINSNGFAIGIPNPLLSREDSPGGGLTKLGAGSLTLGSSGSTYTGETLVSAGTLIIDGNISTSVVTTVENGAALAGSGTVGNLVIEAGGTLNPGNSPGILNVDGNYTQAGTLVVEINGLTPGTGHDQVNVDRISGNGLVSLSGSLSTLFGSFTPASNDLIFILLNDGDDAISGTFTGLGQGDTVGSFGGFDWQISYQADSTGVTFLGGNDIALMAIPEPSSALLAGLGAIALLRRRR